MKTIKEKVYVNKKNLVSKRFLIKGIVVTSLMLSFLETSDMRIEAASKNEVVVDHEYKNYYDSQYLALISNVVVNKYDQVFRDCYYNGVAIVNNNRISIEDLYIVELEDGSFHLVNIDKTNFDILTQEEIVDNYDLIVEFRNTTAFLKLYEAGKMINNVLNVDDSIKGYIDNWDLECHENVLELFVSREASRRTRRHFNR